MARRIDRRTALRLLRKAVEERGRDHVTPSGGCIYFEVDDDAPLARRITDTPSCIVGVALTLVGNEALTNLLRTHNNQFFHNLPTSKFVSRSAYNIFVEAQRLQDEHWTWGDVVDTVEASA